MRLAQICLRKKENIRSYVFTVRVHVHMLLDFSVIYGYLQYYIYLDDSEVWPHKNIPVFH